MANLNPNQYVQYVARAYTNGQTVFRLIMVYLALIVLSVLVVPIFVNVGQNGYFNICLLGDSFVVFGGVLSFLALLGIITLLGGLFIGLYFLVEFADALLTAGIVLVALIGAFLLGSLIHIDLAFFGGAWSVAIYLLILAGITIGIGAVLGIFRDRHNY